MMNNGKHVILVAEDDPLYTNIYINKLSKEGYEVISVNNGADALKQTKERKPDLIILDLVMPVMNGFETLQALKTDEETKNTKVLVVTNLGQDSDIAKAKGLGAEEYFVKANLSITDLMAKVNEYVN
jgi:twitching motility two-component system response regulator PilH